MHIPSLIFFVYPDPRGAKKINLLPPRLRVAATAEQGWGWGK